MIGQRVEIDVGVSLKVIHPVLNNCKSFFLNAKQVNDMARISSMVLIGQF
jgi:hypothetical protein